jgi:hypothetical protein
MVKKRYLKCFITSSQKTKSGNSANRRTHRLKSAMQNDWPGKMRDEGDTKIQKGVKTPRCPATLLPCRASRCGVAAA